MFNHLPHHTLYYTVWDRYTASQSYCDYQGSLIFCNCNTCITCKVTDAFCTLTIWKTQPIQLES